MPGNLALQLRQLRSWLQVRVDSLPSRPPGQIVLRPVPVVLRPVPVVLRPEPAVTGLRASRCRGIPASRRVGPVGLEHPRSSQRKSGLVEFGRQQGSRWCASARSIWWRLTRDGDRGGGAPMLNHPTSSVSSGFGACTLPARRHKKNSL
jgi:hypothetical protein